MGGFRGQTRQGHGQRLPEPAQGAGAVPAAQGEEGRGEVSARQGGADPPCGHDRAAEAVLQVRRLPARRTPARSPARSPAHIYLPVPQRDGTWHLKLHPPFPCRAAAVLYFTLG